MYLPHCETYTLYLACQEPNLDYMSCFMGLLITVVEKDVDTYASSGSWHETIFHLHA